MLQGIQLFSTIFFLFTICALTFSGRNDTVHKPLKVCVGRQLSCYSIKAELHADLRVGVLQTLLRVPINLLLIHFVKRVSEHVIESLVLLIQLLCQRDPLVVVLHRICLYFWELSFFVVQIADDVSLHSIKVRSLFLIKLATVFLQVFDHFHLSFLLLEICWNEEAGLQRALINVGLLRVVVRIVLQKAVIDVEDEEQLWDEWLSLHQVLCQDRFFVVVMQVAHINFKPELLWQIWSSD